MKKYPLSFQKNIRDIGGLLGYQDKKIKYGKFYRGGALVKLTDEDIDIIKSFNLTDIVDFRSSDEYISRPDYRLNGVTYHNYPVLPENPGIETIAKKEDGNLIWFVEKGYSGYEHLKKMYHHLILTEEGIAAYKNFFKIIMQEDKVIYFHCSQGKDRAGFAAYLIEIALGVSDDVAINDYLLSNEAMAIRVEFLLDKIKEETYFDEKYKESLINVFSAKLDYLNETIKSMKEHYGGTIEFIQNVLEVDIDKLREMYLE